MKTKNMTIQHFGKSIDQSPLRLVFFLISLVLVCLVLSPAARGEDGTVGPPANHNTTEGYLALDSLTSGTDNTALGASALRLNTTGSFNTACGRRTLTFNTSGSFNTAVGIESLFGNTSGSDNVVVGGGMQVNDIGNDNLALGDTALPANTSGNQNLAVGTFAGGSTTGSRNTSLGFNAGINADTGSNNIDIGNQGAAGESNTIRIGEQVAVAPVLPPDYPYSHANLAAHTATYIAGISGVAVTGTPVVVKSNGQLGVGPSSKRFKAEIKPMDKASEAILALRPVTFRYKKEIDPDGIAQFGLVAEEVEKVNPALVARDAQGKPYTVRYEAVNAMLLNEFLKEHRQVQELRASAAEQKTEIAELKRQLRDQAEAIQKVNQHVELNVPSRQLIVNRQ